MCPEPLLGSATYRYASTLASSYTPGDTSEKMIRPATARPFTDLLPIVPPFFDPLTSALSRIPPSIFCDSFMPNKPTPRQVDLHSTTTTEDVEGSPVREGLGVLAQPLRKWLIANRTMAAPHRAEKGGVAGGGCVVLICSWSRHHHSFERSDDLEVYVPLKTRKRGDLISNCSLALSHKP